MLSGSLLLEKDIHFWHLKRSVFWWQEAFYVLFLDASRHSGLQSFLRVAEQAPRALAEWAQGRLLWHRATWLMTASSIVLALSWAWVERCLLFGSEPQNLHVDLFCDFDSKIIFKMFYDLRHLSNSFPCHFCSLTSELDWYQGVGDSTLACQAGRFWTYRVYHVLRRQRL